MLRIALVLGLVSALAAGILASAHERTRDRIALQERAAEAGALRDIFFRGFARCETLAPGIEAVYLETDRDEPSYFAVTGAGLGYAPEPIRVLAGFVHPDREAGPLLEGYLPAGAKPPEPGAKGLFLVGWKTTACTETPGLGDKIKDSRPDGTWAQKIAGTVPPADPDRATGFQRQFRGIEPSGLRLRKDGGTVDAITAATYSTVGVMKALQDAEERLRTFRAAKR